MGQQGLTDCGGECRQPDRGYGVEGDRSSTAQCFIVDEREDGVLQHLPSRREHTNLTRQKTLRYTLASTAGCQAGSATGKAPMMSWQRRCVNRTAPQPAFGE